MSLQRLINSNLKTKLLGNARALANQLTSGNHTAQDGQAEDKILYKNMAHGYNRMNDIVTLGHHRYWRRTVINNIDINENSKILDSAGGTGMNTIRLLEKAKNFKVDSNFLVTLYDINPVMMKIGQDNVKRMGYNEKFVRWREGDIQKLPFNDKSFDTYLMFFGIRQNLDFDQVFKEAYRVLKSNGRIVIGEICYSNNPAITQWLYVKFLRYVGAKLVKLFFKTDESTMFLLNNVLNLPSQDRTIAMLKDAGFQRIEFKSLSWKIAGVYVGHKH